MLLTERVSVYDNLAKELAKVGFQNYKNKLFYGRGFIQVPYEFYYKFPVKGMPTNHNFKDLDSKISFSIQRGRSFDTEYDYYFNGDYSSTTNNINIVLVPLNPNSSIFEKDFDWQEFYFHLLQTIRHELEHQVQYLRADGIPVHYYDTEKDADNRKYGLFRNQISRIYATDIIGRPPKIQALYTTQLASEVEAQLKSFYLIYKKNKRQSMNKLLIQALKRYDFDADDSAYVISEWEKYRKAYFPYMPSLK